MEYIFELPISVNLPRKTKQDKKIMLNLNVYRNLHYRILSDIKKRFRPITLPWFKADKIEISYQVEKTTRRKFDTMNIISIVDKFFLDWLVNNEYIPDDNFKNVSYGNITGKYNCDRNIVIAIISTREDLNP